MAVNSFNAQNPPVNTKGDLFTFSTIPTKLGVGSNNQVLTADSTAATGLKWATPSGGKIVQIVTATTSTQTTSASTTWSTTNLTATITPTSASNTILVMVNQNGCMKTGANTNGGLRLVRGATTLKQFDDKFGDNSTTSQSNPTGYGFMWSDSPATTSATTYKTEFHNAGGTGTVYVQFGGPDTASSIVLMEVSA